MKILFLTSRVPFPPHRGDRVRTFNFLRRLSKEHEIRLITFLEAPEEQENLRVLERHCQADSVLLRRFTSYRNMLFHVSSPLPLQVHYYRSSEMKRLVDRRMREERFDLVYTHLFRMVPYAPRQGGLVRVLDLTDCISRELLASIPHRPWFLRPALKLEATRIRRFEAAATAEFDEVWTISDSDRSEIAEMAPRARIQVVRNGVEPALFDTVPFCGEPRLGFLGNFSVPHNIDAARFLVVDIMPRIRRAVPAALVELIGHGVQGAVRKLDGRNGAIVTGPVEDLRGAFGRLAAFVAPLRFAAGVQNKIVEAMAAGLPVVTSSYGNCGLQAERDKEILIGDDPEEFARAVISLLGDPNHAARIGQNGRAFVRRRFTWDAVAERVAALAQGPSPSAQSVPR